MKDRSVVALTMKQARMLDIVRCASCGYRLSNHFDFGKRKCAHTDRCTGWRPMFTMGRPIFCNKQKKRRHIQRKPRNAF